MHWHYTPYVLPVAFSASVSAALGLYAWHRRTTTAPWAGLALLAAAAAWYATGYTFEVLAADLPVKILWAKLEYLGIASIPPLYLVFALQYAGLGELLQRRNVVALAVVPAVTVLLAFTNEAHGLIWSSTSLEATGSALLFVPIRGVFFWAFTAFSYSLMLLGTGLLASATLQTAGPYRWQGTIVLAAVVLPVLSNLGYGLGITPLRNLNPTPIAFGLWVALVTVAIYRFGFLDLVPVARQALIDRMPDGVLVLDAQGRIVDLNPALALTVGLRPASAIGQPAEKALAGWPELVAGLRQSGNAEVDVSSAGGSSEQHYVLASLPMWDSAGRLAGRLVVLRDVTSVRQLEAQFRQAQRMEIIGRLAGGVAHDFNNLLTAITGYASLARDALPAGHPSQDDMDRILRAAERGSQLTRQLLAFARSQAMSPAPLNLNSLLQDIEDLLPRTMGDSIKLNIVVAADLGLIRGDPDQLGQVIGNLVLNAVDAMPTGGVLTIETANVIVSEEEARRHQELVLGEYVTLRVSDTGTGMSTEVQEHLFEPFFTTKEASKGTGLGLATVYGIVKQHRGSIEVTSEVGRGSAFRIYLPGLAEEGLSAR